VIVESGPDKTLPSTRGSHRQQVPGRRARGRPPCGTDLQSGPVYFATRGETKLDLARYYLSVGNGIVRALCERPCMLHRFPDGASGRRYTRSGCRAGRRMDRDVRVDFPSGRHAYELCVTELASVIWAVQMSTVEFHPWNSRRADTESPDEWRIDLDPMPDCGFDTVRRWQHVVREVLDELGAVGWPKTSGGKGMHIYVRIHPTLGIRRRTARRLGIRARNRATRAGRCDDDVVA